MFFFPNLFIYAGFCILELSKSVMYQCYYCKILPYFGEDNVELHFMATDSFVFSSTPIKGLVNDSKHLSKAFDLS